MTSLICSIMWFSQHMEWITLGHTNANISTYFTEKCIVFGQLNLRMTLIVSKSKPVCPLSRLYRPYTVRYVSQNNASCIRNITNPLTPNDHYSGLTVPLTYKCCILYSTNIGTEYFKHGIYSSFFPPSKCSLFHNSNVFCSCIIHILYTGCAKIKK